MRPAGAVVGSVLSGFLCAVLTGCGVSDPAPSGPVPLPALHGAVYGGQQGISGAKVYLYAAGETGTSTTGYGANATSLLNSPGYVTSNPDGSWSLTSDYNLAACQSAHDQVYVVSLGGNAGGGANTSIALMSALGDCANLSSSTFIWVNEVTTVASVYALQQFMNTTAGNYNIGTSSTNVTGLKNAFLTVGNLVNTTNGNALATTPNGNGTVPQGEINTLANIIGACVNTATGSTICSNLMNAAKPAGGTLPTDTLGAMLDIALNPGNNVSTLYGLPSATPPFAPPLGTQPNDWTLAVKYTGGGLSSPWYPAVDANGNVWVPDDVNVSGQGVLSEFNTLGVSLQGTTGLTNVDVPENPTTVAIDPSGYVWAAGPTLTTVGKLTSSGAAVTSYNTNFCNTYMIAFDAGGDLYVPYPGTSSRLVCEVSATGVISYAATQGAGAAKFLSIAIDASGHLWTPYGNYGGVREWAGGQLAQNGSQTYSDFTDATGSSLVGDAIDAGGNAWFSETGGAIVTELSSSGSVLSGSGYTVAGTAQTIAVDGANTIWTAGLTNGTLTHLTNAGVAISPAAGYKAAGATAEYGMALDASGNIWTTDSGGYLFEWVGAAAPVATPLVQQIVNSPNTLGARP